MLCTPKQISIIIIIMIRNVTQHTTIMTITNFFCFVFVRYLKNDIVLLMIIMAKAQSSELSREQACLLF